MFKLVRFLKGYEKQLIIGPLFKLTEAIFELIVPVVMASIIDKGVNGNDTSYVYKMGGVLLLLAIVGLACALTCQYLASVASQGTGTALRNELFRHINSFSHAELDSFGTHSLVLRMTNDINQIQLAVAMLIRLVIRAPFLAAGAVIMAVRIAPQLSLIIFVVTPVITAVIYIIMTKLTPFYKVIQKKLEKVTLIVRENLTGARVIRSFSKQSREQVRFDEAGNDLTDTVVRVGKISALLNPLTSTLMNIGIIAVIWFGGYYVNSGSLTQGELVALINYMTQILLALLVVADMVLIFTRASASASRINEVFELRPSVTESADACEINLNTENPAIKFNNISFSYNREKMIFDDLNLCINQNELIGIIGGTGSGKTTLVNLIARLYDVTSGEIEIFGENVKAIKLGQLRDIIKIVPQQVSVISGTIADNVRWGNENASDEEVWEALRTAQAEEFVRSKPDKLNTYIDQGGKNISGGQKQRITIARAIVGKPKILIMDDSSSALDARTDQLLRKAVSENRSDMTVIIISQRAGTLKNSDRIFVMDNGEIVGVGKHDTLYDNCDLYREICESQSVSREV